MDVEERCPSCGELLLVDAIRCPNCDAEVMEQAVLAPMGPPPNPPRMAPPPNSPQGSLAPPPLPLLSPMAPPPNPPRRQPGWMERVLVATVTWLPVRVVLGLCCVPLAVVFAVGPVAANLSQHRLVADVDCHGASIDGIVRFTEPGFSMDSAIVSFTAPGSSRTDTRVQIGDREVIERNDRVLVRYDLDDPKRAYLPSSTFDPYGLVLGPLLGAGLAWAGVALLSSARRAGRRIEAHDARWAHLTSVLGLATWLGFAIVAKRSSSRALRGWAVVYGAGAIVAVSLLAGALLWPALGPVGVAIWLTVWLGGMLHALFLVGRVRPPAGAAADAATRSA